MKVQYFDIWDEVTNKTLQIIALTLEQAEGISDTLDFNDFNDGDEVNVLEHILNCDNCKNNGNNETCWGCVGMESYCE